MDWIKDIAIPVAAIVVSSGIAVWLAKSERKAAERARRYERIEAEKHRRADRADERKLREEVDIREAVMGMMGALAPMVSMNVTVDPVGDMLRNLRLNVMVFQATITPIDRPFSEAFTAEAEALKSQVADGIRLMSQQLGTETAMHIAAGSAFLELAQKDAGRLLKEITTWSAKLISSEDLEAKWRERAVKREADSLG